MRAAFLTIAAVMFSAWICLRFVLHAASMIVHALLVLAFVFFMDSKSLASQSATEKNGGAK
jgi:hypothetical protein